MCEIVKWWEVATPHMELSSVLSEDLEGWVGERVGGRLQGEGDYV